MEDLALFQTQDEQFSASGMYFPDQNLHHFSDESPPTIFDTKEDLQLLFDWQDHVGSIPDSLCDDLDLKFNIDLKTDLPDFDSPILTNALTSPVPIKIEPEFKRSSNTSEKIVFPGDVEPLQVSSSIQTDNVLKRITQARSVLINGEKEIFGKNIIGLHCLNEIKTSPEENCQITSTVINGKRYKVIIRPKSTTRSIPPLPPCYNTLKPTDELISELQDGDYDVLGHEDVLDPWALPLEERQQMEEPEVTEGAVELEEGEVLCGLEPPPDPPRVPPLRIKIPKKVKKHKGKKEALKASCLSELLLSFEDLNQQVGQKEGRTSLLRSSARAGPNATTHSFSASFSANRKKSLIAISGDSVQLDHDYCSFKRRQSSSSMLCGKDALVEKNPRKDSGLESGGVSDASEESPVPDSPESPGPTETTETPQLAPILAQQLTSKLLEERRRTKNHNHVTKMATALFRASNAATCGSKKVERMTSSSEAQEVLPQNCDIKTTSENCHSPCEPFADRPKKKLKLEEYLSRRHDKDKDDIGDNSAENTNGEEVESIKSADTAAVEVAKIHEQTGVETTVQENPGESCERIEGKINLQWCEGTENVEANDRPQSDNEEKSLKQVTNQLFETFEVKQGLKTEFGLEQGEICSLEVPRRSPKPHQSPAKQVSQGSRRRQVRRCSSSSTSIERSYRHKSLSRSRKRRSSSRDRRRTFWSPSRRSSSRDSSSSSGGSSKRRSSLSSLRYRRRSRTRSRSPYRSISRDNTRARSRVRGSKRQSFFGYSRKGSGGRSRSPVYSQREKQRQIEERRVVYVGRIPEGTTNKQLRQRFSAFGPIIDISVHFRERADNYGFVTYAYKDDAYQAVEHGNDNPTLPRYDLCFGGRRSFCKQRYSDLDGMPTSYSGFKDTPVIRSRDESFDLLLKKAKAKLHKRKEVT